MSIRNIVLGATLMGVAANPLAAQSLCPNGVLTGAAVLASSWQQDAPLTCRQVTPADLPAPGPATGNSAIGISRPPGRLPSAPPGFTVTLAYADPNAPRLLHTAPNGDIFVSESDAGVVRVLRPDGKGGFAANSVFASGLNYPFGVTFFPRGSASPSFVYVAQTNGVVRFAYHSGDLVASGPGQPIVALPSGGNHVSRDVLFVRDPPLMLVSVGSSSNDANNGEIASGAEHRRADILDAQPDGSGLETFAWGLRNPVAMAVEPRTGAIWTTVNERDELGDNLVPDYVTHVERGKFYGWPWYYIGNHLDPRHTSDARAVSGVVVPDTLFVSHTAPLGLAFGAGPRFPAVYQRGAFVATHGSWNRANRNGAKVVFVPTAANGTPANYYEDFLTGFTIGGQATADGTGTWGRPVGVTFGSDGALYVADDWARVIWRVDYPPPASAAR